MPNWLLSYFSPEALSWGGFVVLSLALVGEAGTALIAIISKGETLHKELTFILALIAAGGYAIERIGDDAILDGIKTRATQAEQQLKKFSPRDLSSAAKQSVAGAVRRFKGQEFNGSVSPAVDDGCSFWKTLKQSLEEGEWIRAPLAPNMIKSCDGDAGVPVSTNPGVTIQLHAAKQDALSSPAKALAGALTTLHIKADIATTGNDQNDAENNVIWIMVGVRTPAE
jgi:hypothetical protein